LNHSKSYHSLDFSENPQKKGKVKLLRSEKGPFGKRRVHAPVRDATARLTRAENVYTKHLTIAATEIAACTEI